MSTTEASKEVDVDRQVDVIVSASVGDRLGTGPPGISERIRLDRSTPSPRLNVASRTCQTAVKLLVLTDGKCL